MAIIVPVAVVMNILQADPEHMGKGQSISGTPFGGRTNISIPCSSVEVCEKAEVKRGEKSV